MKRTDGLLFRGRYKVVLVVKWYPQTGQVVKL